MKRCAALTKGGGRCQRIASDGSGYCYSHDPAMAEDRRRNAQRAGQAGGRGRPAKLPGAGELAVIRGELARLYKHVLFGRIDTGTASVAVQVEHARMRALELARRVEDQAELEERLELLESRIKGRGVG
jgi:hypothetical protein